MGMGACSTVLGGETPLSQLYENDDGIYLLCVTMATNLYSPKGERLG